MDKAVDESNNWKRELSALEAQIPSDESQKRLEVAIKEEVEAAWKQKLSVISEENESLNEMVMFLQQVRQNLQSINLDNFLLELKLEIKLYLQRSPRKGKNN